MNFLTALNNVPHTGTPNASKTSMAVNTPPTTGIAFAPKDTNLLPTLATPAPTLNKLVPNPFVAFVVFSTVLETFLIDDADLVISPTSSTAL